MKSRRCGHRAGHLRCLSCGAILDSPRQSFCDKECEEYAKRYGFRNYQTPKIQKYAGKRRR